MADAQVIAVTADPPWLPSGSRAEVWAGDDCHPPDPVIIVRLLLTTPEAADPPQFFCVPTSKGLDLPSRFLGDGHDRLPPARGLAALAGDVLGTSEVETRCVGYVRNVVPRPAHDYAHPVPFAAVPVFAAVNASQPVTRGEWITADDGAAQLATRHWWPIVEAHLGRPKG